MTPSCAALSYRWPMQADETTYFDRRPPSSLGGKSPMRNVFSRLFTATSLSLVVAATAVAAEAPKIPRTKDGKPDLNGIWQTLNSANYDLEPHAARAALAHGSGSIRTGAGAASRRAGRRGFRTRGPRRRRRRLDPVQARSARKEEGEPEELAHAPIRRSSAICPACRVRPTCRTRSRSSRARTIRSSRMSTRAPSATSI